MRSIRGRGVRSDCGVSARAAERLVFAVKTEKTVARVAPNGHWEIGFGDTEFRDVCSTSPRQEATGTQSGEGWTWGPPHTQRVRAVVAGGVPLQTECRWRKSCPKRSRGPSFAGLGDKESEREKLARQGRKYESRTTRTLAGEGVSRGSRRCVSQGTASEQLG